MVCWCHSSVRFVDAFIYSLPALPSFTYCLVFSVPTLPASPVTWFTPRSPVHLFFIPSLAPCWFTSACTLPDCFSWCPSFIFPAFLGSLFVCLLTFCIVYLVFLPVTDHCLSPDYASPSSHCLVPTCVTF